jgi:hydroxymethylbilane synthase
MPSSATIILATRGSALALAQTNLVLEQCRKAFPRLRFDLKIIKTTGDKLQTASLAQEGQNLPKGLFTKELEVALLKQQADFAVHSLKDLPADLPAGLRLGAVTKRADVRDVLIYRDADYLRREEEKRTATDWTPGQATRRGFKPECSIQDLPVGATIGTSSPRRKAQLLALRSGLNIVEIRGNVVTRLQKLFERPELDALILAAAGLQRLNFQLFPDGRLRGDAVPDGLLATVIEADAMLPCVGQGALGIEIRENDGRTAAICERLNHFNTQQCVLAERAFLSAMGGGCQSPVAAYAEIIGHQLRLRAISFCNGSVRRGEVKGTIQDALILGGKMAAELK